MYIKGQNQFSNSCQIPYCIRTIKYYYIIIRWSQHLTLKGSGHAILGNFCLILSITSSKRQIGRARVFHLQNQGHITTENDFPAV